jgi:hypothetical protein
MTGEGQAAHTTAEDDYITICSAGLSGHGVYLGGEFVFAQGLV